MTTKRPRVSRLLPAALLLGLAVAAPAAAQHPNRARGLDPEGTYQQMGEIDLVNLFNGAPVIRIPIGQSYPAGALAYSLTLYHSGNVWDQEQREDQQGFFTQALPNRRSNAGLGWLLSLGRLIPPTDPTNFAFGHWIYESPDGADHVLYATLHNGETMLPDVFYSRDDTYLRFKSTPMTLEFPDGRVHTFDATGRLTKIGDKFNNYVNVTYPNASTWQLTDQHGRSHFVYFADFTYDTWTQKMVDSIVVKTFNGTTATYDFGYASTTISRHCIDNDPQTATGLSVPLLTSVVLPDASSYSIATTDYDRGDGIVCSDASGQLRGMVLPTLGRLEWDYATWVYPSLAGTCNDFLARSNGISKRRLRRADGIVESEWTYTPALDAPDGCANPNSRELKVTVNDPLAHKQEHFFSVSITDTGAWKKGEYGMPFTHSATDGTGTRFLANRTYSGATTLLRSGFARWEFEPPWETTPTFSLYDGNRRLQSIRTVFDDDGSRYADLDFSNFDGLGHYRQSDTNGNFDSGNIRQTFTNLNPTRGTYGVNFTMVGSTEPWVLQTYDYQTATEGGVTSRTESCFSTSTGALNRVRTLKTGTARGANDLLVVFNRNSSGQVTQERYFGGDAQSLGTNGCTLGLPTSVYDIRHTYQYGASKTSRYHDGAGTALSFYLADRDIDLNTGLVKASRDTSAIKTDFEYDSLGRLRHSKPVSPHDGWTENVYTRATSPTSLARTNVYRRTNGGGTTLAQSEQRYDSFGRPSEELVLMPSGSWSSRATTYNGRGWRSTVSELGSPGSLTQFLNYDPFGRPGIVRPPDGSAHDVAFAYSGARYVYRTVKVATSESGGSIVETAATTWEIYDRQGRLDRVVEPPGGLLATHGYDVGNRVKSVATTDGTTTQTRLFTYDNRGFMSSEQHPEKGASGNGTVTYSSYDARGHAGRRIDGLNDLTFTYDRAERVTQVKETGGLQRFLKEFTYGTSNASGVWDNGKVKTAKRYNYALIGGAFDPQVTETYFYAGRHGRISQRDSLVTVAGPTWGSFTQSWTYTDLGQRASMGYPDCTFSPCSTQVSDPEGVSFSYTNGFLSSVPGHASSITYHPNAMVNQVSHFNGVVDTFASDPFGMARPGSIQAAYSGTQRWSSGAYQYDGTGSVAKVGSAMYLYDACERLSSGKVYLDPLGGGAQVDQGYGYDPFGNIQTITGTSARNTPTSSATNRLTDANGGITYDSAGNLTLWNGNTYAYDAFNQMSRMTSGSEDWYYFYTADDERIWMYKPSTSFKRWKLRGLDRRVLATYIESGGVYSRERQLLYRDNTLLAAKLSAGAWNRLHVDHLGTPRAVTDFQGVRTAYHAYYGFGEEATAFDQDDERMKFTGHERDLASPAGAGDDLDYMHSRHFNPMTARFTSTDRASGSMQRPQSWNRYNYVLDSPLRFIDPDGQVGVAAAILGRAALGAAIGGFFQLAVNYGIQTTLDPNYPLWTGVPGAALAGAIGGAVPTSGILAPIALTSAASATGSVFNAYIEGSDFTEVTQAAIAGFATGLVAGTAGVVLGPTGRLGSLGDDYGNLGLAATTGAASGVSVVAAGVPAIRDALFPSPASGAQGIRPDFAGPAFSPFGEGYGQSQYNNWLVAQWRGAGFSTSATQCFGTGAQCYPNLF